MDVLYELLEIIWKQIESSDDSDFHAVPVKEFSGHDNTYKYGLFAYNNIDNLAGFTHSEKIPAEYSWLDP